MQNKKKLLILGDSLGLARPAQGNEPELSESETWPTHLQDYLQSDSCQYVVIRDSARRRTSKTLRKAWGAQEHYSPDLIVVQIGVVDCAPRIFSRLESRLLNLSVFPASLRRAWIKYRSDRRSEIISKNPLRKVYVSPSAFRKNIHNFINSLNQDCKILFISILGNTPVMDAKSPGFSKNRDLYNSILQGCVSGTAHRILDYSAEPEDFWVDGYHLNVRGNKKLAEAVALAVQEG